ncbi:hypothetical protein Tco_0704119 [Tanacetum coccineum]|uniref:Uncharacterized protein n=1 Tax=Tanacetum coccineum TaxID=301880 RepID=A0ABQ4Y0S4_9ASTR
MFMYIRGEGVVVPWVRAKLWREIEPWRTTPWRRRYIYREREEAEERLIDDYFGDNEYEPKYPEETFRRRRSLRVLGPILKRTSAIRQLAYGTAPDAFDEYLQIAERYTINHHCLEKHLYDSWKSRMEMYMLNRPHGRMILASVEKRPLVWPSITVDGVTRLKEYIELTPAEAIQADCDIKAINIILQGLPTEIYALVSQHRIAKDLWDED